MAKARDLAADEVMLDLEDSVAPAAKEAARGLAVAALAAGGWDGKLVAVRINRATTRRSERAPGPQRVKQAVGEREAVQVGGVRPHRRVGVVPWDQRPPGHLRRVVPDVEDRA